MTVLRPAHARAQWTDMNTCRHPRRTIAIAFAIWAATDALLLLTAQALT